jgi:predicted alternative tryptophan synthase beta-subunit
MNILINKWANKLNSFLKKKYKWQYKCEEVFNILSHKGNTNLKDTKIPSQPSRMAIIKKTYSNEHLWNWQGKHGILIYC